MTDMLEDRRCPGLLAEPAAAPSGGGDLPTGYVNGLGMTWIDAASVQLELGSCRDDGDAGNMVLAASDAAAFPGDLDAGAEAANTWYYLWIIADSTAVNPTKALISASSTAPTVPVGYDLKRRIGSFRNDNNSDILEFIVTGSRARRLRYRSPFGPRNILNAGNAVVITNVSAQALVPPTARTFSLSSMQQGTTFARLYWTIDGPPAVADLIYTQQQKTNVIVEDFPSKGDQIFAYSNAAAGGSVDLNIQGYQEAI